MNGGICGALVALNTVFVLIAAFFMFKERLNLIKLIAMALLIVSVVLISLFCPDTTAMFIIDDHLSNSLPQFEQQQLFNQIYMIARGLIASVSFGS